MTVSDMAMAKAKLSFLNSADNDDGVGWTTRAWPNANRENTIAESGADRIDMVYSPLLRVSMALDNSDNP